MKLPALGRRLSIAAMLFAAAVIACMVALVLNAVLSEVAPSTTWGVTYGAIALVLMLGVMAYAVRRRAPRHGPGRAHAWLQFHIYGGTLFLLLVMMHAGFRRPRGALSWGLWLVSSYVVASGLLGLLLQRWLPRMLTSAFATEVNYDRIPDLVDVLRRRAEELIYGCDDAVQKFYEANLRPVFTGPQPRFSYFMGGAGGIHSRVGQLEHLRPLMSDDPRKLDALKLLLASKLEMDAQFTLQKALRLWLHGHVPATFLLLMLVGVHLYSVWYY